MVFNVVSLRHEHILLFNIKILCKFLAEREGFEPSERLRAQRFSRPPRSTTPAPLQGEKVLVGGAVFFKGLADRYGKSEKWWI